MADAVDKTAPPKSGMKGWLLLGLVGVIAAGAGGALPWLLFHEHHAETAPVEKESKKTALIAFGDAVVNLGEDRLTRYLRFKLILVVDQANEKAVNNVLQEQKPFLKNWLISYISDQSLQEVGRASGVNRIRREIRDQFNAMLFADGSERINDVLFDEFVVQ
jgi:flagellar FliL protein